MSSIPRLFKNSEPVTLKKGEILSVDSTTFYIEEGYVGVYQQKPAKAKKLLFIYKPGECFPFLYVNHEMEDGKMLYGTLDRTIIRSLPTKVFEKEVLASPSCCREIIKFQAYIHSLSLQRIANLGNPNTMTRLLERLIFSANRFGIVSGNRIIIAIPLTHTDIALAIGTTRETVNRLLNKLEDMDLIVNKDRMIVVKSLDKLIKLRNK